MGKLRKIAAIPVPGVEPNEIDSQRPTFLWVDPRTLHVEESYQRDLAEKSINLIRRIVSGWDWKAMKPPVCARTADGSLMVIDGQHTAIAASTHPDINEIPVMIVSADTIADRARAFVRHNQDRIAMTATQIFYAALASGDDVAIAVQQACDLSGVKVLRNPPSGAIFKVGDTMGVVTLRSIVESRGVKFTARLLRILVDAKRAPVGSIEIAAVNLLLTEPEWKDEIDPDDLSVLIRTKSARDWVGHAEMNVRKGMKMPMYRALAIAWFKKVPKRRRAAA